MKKLLIVLLSLAMIFALAACSGKQANNPATDEEDPAVSTSASFPAGKTITMLCGQDAGSSTDLGCRLVATALSNELGCSVIVENIPGSSNWLCYKQLLSSAADGYTFSNFNMNGALGHYRAENPVDETIDDFILLANQADDPSCIFWNKDETRFSDFESFVEYAQNNKVYVGISTNAITSGSATPIRWLKEDLGCDVEVVQAGSAEEILLYQSGQTDFRVGNVGDVYTDDSMYVGIVFSDQPSPFLPDAPTSVSLGYELPRFVAGAILKALIRRLLKS